MDFHGTGGGGTVDAPVEEYYATEALIELADQQRFIVVRPRSRWAMSNATRVYQWDSNPRDLDKNAAYARQLLAYVMTRYHVDARRVYASGFSNGTNMAAQFLADAPPVFRGYAFHAGGIWNQPLRGTFGADSPRIYTTTGYRDYMFSTQQALHSYLSARAFPASQLWVRESDTGHDLYGWHFAETFGWLDRGARPSEGVLADGWTSEAVPTGGQSLVQLATSPSGELVAGGTGGLLFRRATDGTWSQTGKVLRSATYAPVFTDLCILPSGRGIAVGEGTVAITDDGGATWSKGSTIPELGLQQFGYSYLTTVDCDGSRITGGGYWAAVTSTNGGVSFGAASMLSRFDYPSQVSAIRFGPSGTSVAVGYYNYLGVSADGVRFKPQAPPSSADWFTDVTPGPNGHWWVVGERGTVMTSSDDGLSWTELPSGTSEDLYAVDFHDERIGLAVGAHGTAILTANGGATWQRISTGLDKFLGDVRWLDEKTALVVGEAGTAIRFTRN